MAAVGVREEEQAARERLRRAQRLRKGRERAQAQRERERERRRVRYARWLTEEKDAYWAHAAEPGSAKLLAKWLAVVRAEPQHWTEVA